jgi:hypothetical protein
MTTHNKSIEEEVDDIVDRIISGASSDGGLGWRDDSIYDTDEAAKVILALLKRERKEVLERVDKGMEDLKIPTAFDSVEGRIMFTKDWEALKSKLEEGL